MTREEIIITIRDRADALRAEGVSGLALFGSRMRGDHRPDSDIDVLIDVAPDATFSLLSLIGVQHIIADATGLPTQATTRTSISERFAQRIADDLVEVF